MPWEGSLEEGACKDPEERGASGWREWKAVVQKGEHLFKGQ